MADDGSVIEKRLQNMKNFYLKASELIDNLPESIPVKTRTMLKDTILGDKDLKKLMDGIDSHRPPRIFLIGRTGVGSAVSATIASTGTAAIGRAAISYYIDGNDLNVVKAKFEASKESAEK